MKRVIIDEKSFKGGFLAKGERRVWSISDPCVFGVGAERRPAYCDVRSAGIVTLLCPLAFVPRARNLLLYRGPDSCKYLQDLPSPHGEW